MAGRHKVAGTIKVVGTTLLDSGIIDMISAVGCRIDLAVTSEGILDVLVINTSSIVSYGSVMVQMGLYDVTDGRGVLAYADESTEIV